MYGQGGERRREFEEEGTEEEGPAHDGELFQLVQQQIELY